MLYKASDAAHGAADSTNPNAMVIEESPLLPMQLEDAETVEYTPREQLLRFLLSLPTLVSLVFFIYTSCAAGAISTTTSIVTSNAVLSTFNTTHAAQVASAESAVLHVATLLYNLAFTSLSLYVQSLEPVESNKTLALACAMLAMSDTSLRLRNIALSSREKLQYLLCSHNDNADKDPFSMYGAMILNGELYGNYYIDPVTYQFYEPPRLKGATPNASISVIIDSFLKSLPTFAIFDEYMNGTRSSIEKSDLWAFTPAQPEKLHVTCPVFMLGKDIELGPNTALSDYSQARIDGRVLLNDTILVGNGTHQRAMVLINQSLASDEPLVLADNWGQEPVYTSSYSVVVSTNTTYLAASNVSDPLMRAALRYIDFKALQTQGYRKTTQFTYRHAPAFVTAWTYTNALGLTLPMVLVSAEHSTLHYYYAVRRFLPLMIVGAELLMTALCYLAIDRYVARPLRRLTAAMLASVQRGARQPVRADPCDVLQLTETRELTRAYNTAMAQLRAVDEFVPDALRAVSRDVINASITESHHSLRSTLHRPLLLLQRHYLTIVTVRITPAAAAAARGGGVDTDALLRRHAADTGRGRFAELVNAVAGAQTRMACSGPFRGPAALAAFVAAVRELCDAHHGTVHRVAPDRCVLHFARSVRAALARQPAPADSEAAAAAQDARMERSATADARAAVAFALRLQEWVAERAAEADAAAAAAAAGGAAGGGMPDVRVLVDTGLFTCGQYCASALQQTLSVALGRDAERAVGHVAAQLGVRVALTEETAVRVPGVRQLPVEALHTGRAGLDAAVIILYEALPGRVAGDTAWQLYMRCCFEGFHHMVQGDYAAALSQLRDVAAITDLEPGLLPRSLSREAASSSAVGGAVSTQVARLIGECERRVARGHTVPFQRYRRVPLGVDAVLPNQVYLRSLMAARGNIPAPVPRVPLRASEEKSAIKKRQRSYFAPDLSLLLHGSGIADSRYVVQLNTADGTVKRTLGGRPSWVRDANDHVWLLPRTTRLDQPPHDWQARYVALDLAGGLCSVSTLLLRDVPMAASRKLLEAPVGPMADELRSALPVHTVSAETRAAVKDLLRKQLAESHPYLRRPISYSFAVEGCVTAMWEFSRGGTMRDVIQRYDYLKPTVLHRFSRSVMTALAYLHHKGLVHGTLSLDSIIVGSDGVCCLIDRYTDVEADNSLFVLPRTCYVSPAMAAGHAPTAACDMFCYGLLSLEALTRQPAWRWADVDAADGDGEGGQRAAQRQEELLALMAEGGQAFSAAVVSGAVVPNTALLDSAEVSRRYTPLGRDAVRALLSYTAAERPTAAEVLAVLRKIRDSRKERKKSEDNIDDSESGSESD